MATTEKLEKYNYFINGSNQSVEIIPCHDLRENNLYETMQLTFKKKIIEKKASYISCYLSTTHVPLIFNQSNSLITQMVSTPNLYITKSWSVAFIVATLTLSHVSSHVISIFFFVFFLQIKNIFTPFKILIISTINLK